MGSSYTKFRGKGFWSIDTLLEVWLGTMCLNMVGDVHSPAWQHELRDSWLRACASSPSGCVSASLDEFLIDGERVSVILDVTERSIESLRAFGAYVPAPYMNTVSSALFDYDWPIEWVERIADTFARLLRGELTTDVSTAAPTLPQTRIGQRNDELEQPRKA